jgi:hypothetical protein
MKSLSASAPLRETIFVSPEFEELLRHNQFSSIWVFESPLVKVWRKLDDRENCTVELTDGKGLSKKFHLKRYPHGNDAVKEAKGIELLEQSKIPTAPLAAWGVLGDGRGFVLTKDLGGFDPSDKLIESGTPFEKLLNPTADLAGKFHHSGLHHRDLYLCHFLAKGTDLKLIDAARVKPLPGWPTRRRWIVKDLAQFWYSTTKLPVTDEQRMRWLKRYAQHVKSGSIESLRKAIEAKVRRIAAHDANLNRRQPTRHISIPDGDRR